ncbi:MAG: pentapeptide repeat-containing protein [Deltaproteobacteria bacterium]|nr:pentapeptide repeat-containing protein [Deltaproteobacteria bacterium]
MYMLLREGNATEFNKLKQQGHTCDLRGKDFRGLDLRGVDVSEIDFSNSYFRQADLRGLNLSTCKMDGASIHGARISGTFFPRELSAEEIRLSFEHGSRLRYR